MKVNIHQNHSNLVFIFDYHVFRIHYEFSYDVSNVNFQKIKIMKVKLREEMEIQKVKRKK